MRTNLYDTTLSTLKGKRTMIIMDPFRDPSFQGWLEYNSDQMYYSHVLCAPYSRS